MQREFAFENGVFALEAGILLWALTHIKGAFGLEKGALALEGRFIGTHLEKDIHAG